MVFCGKCGASNPDDFKFCHACGAPIGPPPDIEPVQEAPVEEPIPEPEPVVEMVPEPEPEPVVEPEPQPEPEEPVPEMEPEVEPVPEPEPKSEPDHEPDTNPEPEPVKESRSFEPGGRGGSNTTASKKSNKGAIYAGIIVVIVIIAAIGAYFAFNNDDGTKTYGSWDDLPTDHPLYGITAPDGRYTYEGDITYQGVTIDATLTIGWDNGRYDYYAINGEAMSQSELNELNSAAASLSFSIGEPEKWTDGTYTYDVYPVHLEGGETDLIAENGLTVHVEGESQGMEMDMTLEGWRKGQSGPEWPGTTPDPEPDPEPQPQYYDVEIYDQNRLVYSGSVLEGEKLERPYYNTPEGYILVCFRDSDTHERWDFFNDTVTKDTTLETYYVEHFTVRIDGTIAYFTIPSALNVGKTEVQTGDGHLIQNASGTFGYNYGKDGTYRVIVSTLIEDRYIISPKTIVIGDGGAEEPEPQPEEYTVSFLGAKGNVIDTYTVTEGETIEPTDEFVSEYGYAADSWFLDSSGKIWDFESDTVTSDVTLRPNLIQHFTIEIHGNMVKMTLVDYVRGETTTNYINGVKSSWSSTIETFVKILDNDGRYLMGLKTTKSDGWVLSSAFMIDITVPTYTVKFMDANGNLLHTTYTHGVETIEPYSYDPPAREGYCSSGWIADGEEYGWYFDGSLIEGDTTFRPYYVHHFDVDGDGLTVTMNIADSLHRLSSWDYYVTVIDWGDGTKTTTVAGAEAASHTYSVPGEYRIVVTSTASSNEYSSYRFVEVNFSGPPQGGVEAWPV